jgi:GAF domain-containing protein
MSISERGVAPPSTGSAGPGRPPARRAGDDVGVGLAATLSQVARELQDESGLERTLHAVVASAVDTIPGAEFAGITEVRKRGHELNVRYASDPVVVDVETAQYRLRQGPCLDAAYQRRTVRVDDLAADDRWPEFTRYAGERGIGSMLCLQLYVERGDLGALNLFSTRRHAFTDESEHVGLLFAAHAGVAMAGAKMQEELRTAIGTRDLIGQAKGILMERHKITADQAFLALARASQDANIKLQVLAERLATGSPTEQPGA